MTSSSTWEDLGDTTPFVTITSPREAVAAIVRDGDDRVDELAIEVEYPSLGKDLC